MNRDLSKIIPEDYQEVLKAIKQKISSSQIKAAISVNQELIKLYWEIGNTVYQRQKNEGWGSKIIEKLAKDLKNTMPIRLTPKTSVLGIMASMPRRTYGESSINGSRVAIGEQLGLGVKRIGMKNTFPDMKGFSLRNLQYMVKFAKEYPKPSIMQQVVAQIPWGHNILIMHRLSDKNERIWYIDQTIENGWSRSVLETWIDSDLYRRRGKAVTNFKKTLPTTQSDLADQTIKDPYCFDFLTLRKKHDERELEDGLIEHIQKFLIELGAGFAFVGRQYKLSVSNKEFFIDLLFYHLKLRCFVVVELKAKEFTPRDAGQMNFYLSAVDDLLRQPGDNPTIGLLLCKTKDRVIAEYALRDIDKPIGVSEYETKILESLPDNLRGSLPTIEEIEQEFEKEVEKSSD